MANDERRLVESTEEQKISRKMMAWINACPLLPSTISMVDFEQLPADKPGISLSVIQGAYIIRQFITGGHTAAYEFALTYRIIPGKSNDARLKADETLNAIGAWAVENPPNLEARVKNIEISARSALLVPYEDGSEDHQILMKLEYEVV